MKISKIAIVALGLVLTGQSAFATHGMQPIGIGAASKGMGGAGIAFPQNTFISGYNPAGITSVETQLDMSVAAFNPNRSYRTSEEMLHGDNREVKSKNEIYLMPAFAVNWRVDRDSALAFGMFPHGGGGVVYRGEAPFSKFYPDNPTREGVTTSTELQQMLISGTYARRVIGDYLSLGVSPIIGFQRFKATGIGYFKLVSSEPDNLSDNGFDNSFGYGGKVGAHSRVTDEFQLGASYQTVIKMQRFEKYSGLFAQSGEFDMAPQWAVGAAYTFFGKLTLGLDYQVIEYSKIPALANGHSHELMSAGVGAVGGPDGAGFGWDDVKIIKVGLQYNVADNSKIRLGYSRGNSPIGPEDTLFNMLAPAVTEEHYAMGYSFKYKNDYTFDITYVRTARNSVTGANPNNLVNENVEIGMDQNQLDVGFSMLF